jgi:hypothetical protein
MIRFATPEDAAEICGIYNYFVDFRLNRAQWMVRHLRVSVERVSMKSGFTLLTIVSPVARIITRI